MSWINEGGIAYEPPTGTGTGASGIITLRISDPEARVASVGFEISTLQDGVPQTSGPYLADYPPVVSQSISEYQKEVLLHPTGYTEVRPVIEMVDGSASVRPSPVSFPPRSLDHSLQLLNFREVERTADEVVYGWTPADAVGEVWVHDRLHQQPGPADPWPGKDELADQVLDRATREYRAAVPEQGFVRYLMLTPRSESGAAGVVHRATITALPDEKPTFDNVRQAPGTTAGTTDLWIRLVNPTSTGATLKVWVNHAGVDGPDPRGAPDGSLQVATTPTEVGPTSLFDLTGGGTGYLLDDIRVHAARGKRVYYELVTDDDVSSGQYDQLLLAWNSPIDADGKLLDESIDRAAVFASGIRPVEVVDALPPSGEPGAVVVLTTNSKLYRWTGAGWTASVPTADLTGEIVSTQISDNAITTPKIGAGAITSGKLYSGSVEADKIQAGQIAVGAISAAHINSISLSTLQASVVNLAAIRSDLGEVTAGTIRNGANSAGISLSGGPSGSWTRYMDLSGNGTYFLYARRADGLETLKVDNYGNAEFAGTLRANVTYDNAGGLSGLTNGHIGTITAGMIKHPDSGVATGIGVSQTEGHWAHYVNLTGSGYFINSSVNNVRRFAVNFNGDVEINATATMTNASGTVGIGTDGPRGGWAHYINLSGSDYLLYSSVSNAPRFTIHYNGEVRLDGKRLVLGAAGSGPGGSNYAVYAVD